MMLICSIISRLTMTSPNKAIPSKAAIASEELSCSRPCGLSCTDVDETELLVSIQCNYLWTTSVIEVARNSLDMRPPAHELPKYQSF